MNHIYIIEDDKAICAELTLLLENAGYRVTCASDFSAPAAPLAQFLQASPDLLLLDINLPNTDGFALCMKIRRASQIPIIFITGRDSKMDELQALSLGGDDYITKPYHIPILLARIGNALKRSKGENALPAAVQYGGLGLDSSTCTATYQGACTELSKREMEILYYLMTHSGRYISRVTLIEHLWDTNLYIDDNTLSVNITRLREKLSQIGVHNFIRTKRGMGYIV
ncbi:MAG: response regulator transcription factor [Gemmiger sp.]|nr:response regulator transcription factor [Gemmiger sp.]